MKTLRIAMIAALVAVTMVGMANADGFKACPKKQVVNLPLDQALQNPTLVIQMYNQLSPQMLSNNQLVYTVYVVCGKTVFRISGTYDQWSMFFKHVKIVPKFTPRPPVLSTE